MTLKPLDTIVLGCFMTLKPLDAIVLGCFMTLKPLDTIVLGCSMALKPLYTVVLGCSMALKPLYTVVLGCSRDLNCDHVAERRQPLGTAVRRIGVVFSVWVCSVCAAWPNGRYAFCMGV